MTSLASSSPASAAAASAAASATDGRKRRAAWLERVEAQTKRSKGVSGDASIADTATVTAADSASSSIASAASSAAAASASGASPLPAAPAASSCSPSAAVASSSSLSTAAFSSSSSSSSSAPSASLPSSETAAAQAALLDIISSFPRAQVQEAMRRYGGNAAAALDLLLEGEGSDPLQAGAGAGRSTPPAAAAASSSRPFVLRPSTSAAPVAAASSSAAAAAASAGSAASPAAAGASAIAVPLVLPFIPGIASHTPFGWIFFTPSAPKCTCDGGKKSRSSGGSNIVTLSSLAASSSATPRCSFCRLSQLPSLPSTLSAVPFGHVCFLRTSLDAFLDRYKPSQVRADQAAWILVKKAAAAAAATPALAFGKAAAAAAASSSSDDMDNDDEPNWRDGYGEDRLQAEWAASPSKTAATLETLARRSGYVTGKWMIRSGAGSVDGVWRRVAIAVVRGQLPGVSTAKVSTANLPGLGDPTHVQCIYTRDWTDREDMMRVRQALRDVCDVHWKISYKADIYTTLDIYTKNKYKIKPTICTE